MRAASGQQGHARAAVDAGVVPGRRQHLALVERFSADEEKCLSLWQGVDPGPSLSLVLIDRRPSPGRTTATWARGSVRWPRAAATASSAAGHHAALSGAAGRAGCCAADRGVVAVLDSRMVTAGLGGYLRASLPRLADNQPGPGPRGAGCAPRRRASGLSAWLAGQGDETQLVAGGQHGIVGQHAHRVSDRSRPAAAASSSRRPGCRFGGAHMTSRR